MGTARSLEDQNKTKTDKLRDSEVLEAAAGVFYRHGYAAASVQLIADELGILKGSLYYYTRSKEELLFRLLKHVHDGLGEILNDATSSSEPPLTRLHDYVYRQVEYATRHLQSISIYYRDSDQLSEVDRETINAQRQKHKRFLQGLLAEAQATGEVTTEEDPAVLAELIFGSFIWTYRWFRPSGKQPGPAIAAAAARFAVRAVRPDR